MAAVALESAVPTKRPRVVVYLSEELKADLEALAAKRNRSISNLLETLAKEEVEKAKNETTDSSDQKKEKPPRRPLSFS